MGKEYKHNSNEKQVYYSAQLPNTFCWFNYIIPDSNQSIVVQHLHMGSLIGQRGWKMVMDNKMMNFI